MSPSALHGPGAVRGIEGLRGREPIGVVAAIGKKDSARGFPTEKDRWHLVSPREVDGVRHPVEVYSAFNRAAPENRKMLRGTLVHAAPGQSFSYHLKAQVLPDQPAHPNRRPACVGDGRLAVRWSGAGADEFAKIPCPHERCQYRQPQGRKPAACKPWGQLIFQLRWKEGSPLPSMLAKFTTGGWNTCANLVGFFEHLAEVCGTASAGRPVSLVGFPFLMTLGEQTNREKRTRFPVVRFTPEIAPDAFVRHQLDVVASLPQAPARITDQTDGELAEDWAALNPGPTEKPRTTR